MARQRKRSRPIPHQCSNTHQYTEFNIVYQELVNGKDDVVGQLAYCLYKQSKQQYIQEFEQKEGRSPTNEELRTHVICSEMPSLQMYKGEAERAVKELLTQAAADKEIQLEAYFKDRLWRFIAQHQPEDFLERQSRNLKGLLYGGIGGVVGNTLTTIFLILFLFWASSSETKSSFYSSAKANLVNGFAQAAGIDILIVKKVQPPFDPTDKEIIEIANDLDESTLNNAALSEHESVPVTKTEESSS